MHSTSSSVNKPSGVVPFVPDAQVFLAVLQQFLAAAQHAGNVGADLHVVFTRAAWWSASSSS